MRRPENPIFTALLYCSTVDLKKMPKLDPTIATLTLCKLNINTIYKRMRSRNWVELQFHPNNPIILLHINQIKRENLKKTSIIAYMFDNKLQKEYYYLSGTFRSQIKEIRNLIKKSRKFYTVDI